jgi:hypothetical protein
MYGLSSKDDQALQALADPDMATLRVCCKYSFDLLEIDPLPGVNHLT